MILKIVDDDRQTSVIVTRIDRCKAVSGCCHPWGDDEGASFVDYSIRVNGEQLWMASDMIYPKPEQNHDYCGLSKIIYELLLDKMATNDVIEFNDILRRAKTEHDLRMKGVIK